MSPSQQAGQPPSSLALQIDAVGNDVRVPAAALQQLVVAMLRKAGVPEADSEIVAEGLVSADARGMNSHGVLRLPVYIRRLLAGGFAPVAKFDIIRETAGTALIDGGNGLGAVITTKAMDLAIGKARETGVGIVTVRNSNHNGEGAPYVLRAARQDMIGMATTNGAAIMPVWGGRTPMTGPLPLSFGVPADKQQPIILDAALGMSSRGKILYHAEKKLPIPDGWLVDAEGRPTNDPEWVRKGGWILPIGGHKGWGLILMCEMLTGFLTGGEISREMTNLYDNVAEGQHNSHFCLAINIGSFVDPAFFKRRVDDYILQIKASDKAPGVEEIYMPGEIEFRKEKQQRAEGILLTKTVFDEILASASGLGLAVSIEGQL
jgi:LDH2 family malate/lactate/ureidoglycolate dehydrogenase